MTDQPMFEHRKDWAMFERKLDPAAAEAFDGWIMHDFPELEAGSDLWAALYLAFAAGRKSEQNPAGFARAWGKDAPRGELVRLPNGEIIRERV